ncbi:MAG: hypothetical protein ABI594_00230 [Ginsengibacter sp.]
MGVASIEKQINNYLPQLTVNQKKALLTVAKTFVEDENASAYSDDFKKELDNRYEEYMNGGKLVSEKVVNQRIKKIINGKTKR